MRKWVYHFDEVLHPDKNLLGGKGANLAEMTRIGLPVPPGFTLTTEACHAFNQEHQLPGGLMEQVREQIEVLESRLGKGFGEPGCPLLVSVRSGAPLSMPGMMDTILNLGLNDETALGLAKLTGDLRFAYDCYRRFIQMFADVVLGIPHYLFEQVLTQTQSAAGVTTDQELTANHLLEITSSYLSIVHERTGRAFPQDPIEQLELAIKAVFRSWDNSRAITYRKIHRIPDSLGTAVNVQAMVFGNMGNDSGTGVAFTRDPSTGENTLFGEFLTNAQGEDVVAGIRTPEPISRLKEQLPQVYQEFEQVCRLLEESYKDVQDIEFTVERGRLYILQTRAAKRSAAAAVRIAIDLVREGRIDSRTALSRIDPEQLHQLLHPSIDEKAELNVIAQGLPASPGAASGHIVFAADEAAALAATGQKVLLVRTETTPEDIHGILAATGILTSRGGMTSHAAVVARGMGKPCVCGSKDVEVFGNDTCRIGAILLQKGALVSIDGATGRVFLGEAAVVHPVVSEAFQCLLEWADAERKLAVFANADNPADAERARQFGAEGIGLCRTEHMFMSAERHPLVQSMILAGTDEERAHALARLLPFQREDFYGILHAMDGLPVTIRLLDPPLHEFLPRLEDLMAKEAELRVRLEYEPQDASRRQELVEVRRLVEKVRALAEQNPMLGHRGCRLGLTLPDIYEMQVTAICQAACQLVREGRRPIPEVMIPLVGDVEELRRLRALVETVCRRVMKSEGVGMELRIGTMIEVPRAALTADKIATEADFFSFGTNDLTQTTFGFSRDDAEGKFLKTYLEDNVIAENPFSTIDREGVGQLLALASQRGRYIKPELKIGLCGEHGGEPASIQFCHEIGLSYVSCSPYRVPIARLAAAKAALTAG